MAQISAERLGEVNARSNNVRVGNITYVEQPLRLGALKGNQFEVSGRGYAGGGGARLLVLAVVWSC